MSRWLLLSCCLAVLGAVSSIRPQRSPGALSLGGRCETDLECQVGLECKQLAGVIEGQCAASCNSTNACQERFGMASMCLGADVCARSCAEAADCPTGSRCNDYHWCEASR